MFVRIRELFPEAFRQETVVSFDPTQRRVIGRRQTTFHDLVLRSEPADVPEDQAIESSGRAEIGP